MKNFETCLRSFNNDVAIKEKYLARVKHHQQMDNFIRGVYWDKSLGKGCAVGCTLDGIMNRGNWHKAYEDQLHIPDLFSMLEDSFFERMSLERSKTWPYEFLDAIPVGSDLSKVWPKFAVWLLEDKEYGLIHFAENDDCKQAIQTVIDLYKREDLVSKEEWGKAGAHAHDLADDLAGDCAVHAAVRAAVRAAGRVADFSYFADFNGYTVGAVVDAIVDAIARAFGYAWDDVMLGATWYAAYKKHIESQADKLLELLKETK